MAFPHTQNEKENSLLIALGVCKDGFKDNKELKLIFLACVPKDGNQGLLLAKTYDELISIIKDKKLLDRLNDKYIGKIEAITPTKQTFKRTFFI